MAFPTTSYLPSATIRDGLGGTIALAVASDTLKVALYSDSATFTVNTDGHPYTVTGEVSGTGWAAGGVALASTAITLVTDVGIMVDAADVSESGTTLSTAILGCMVYDDTISPKAGLAVVYFGNASGYTTNNGTFGIQWDSNGIFRMTLTTS